MPTWVSRREIIGIPVIMSAEAKVMLRWPLDLLWDFQSSLFHWSPTSSGSLCRCWGLSPRCPVTVENLSKVEQAEDYLHGLGLREVRARHHDRLCRIEVGEDEMDFAFERRKEIVSAIKKIGYLWVSIDMSGLRSGSLNDQLKLNNGALKI
ncbi:hypothetical protein M1N45_03125 [Dehalococcoidia bacterium]|nr:hypothetical protein [Dehalococcoidia bacterium]